MPISKETLEETLGSAFPSAEIIITDLAGDNDHWEVSIKSDSFNGKNRIQQHQMVFEAVKEHDIHALSIKTST